LQGEKLHLSRHHFVLSCPVQALFYWAHHFGSFFFFASLHSGSEREVEKKMALFSQE
jgi:hypothetical protein